MTSPHCVLRDRTGWLLTYLLYSLGCQQIVLVGASWRMVACRRWTESFCCNDIGHWRTAVSSCRYIMDCKVRDLINRSQHQRVHWNAVASATEAPSDYRWAVHSSPATILLLPPPRVMLLIMMIKVQRCDGECVFFTNVTVTQNYKRAMRFFPFKHSAR